MDTLRRLVTDDALEVSVVLLSKSIVHVRKLLVLNLRVFTQSSSSSLVDESLMVVLREFRLVQVVNEVLGILAGPKLQAGFVGPLDDYAKLRLTYVDYGSKLGIKGIVVVTVEVNDGTNFSIESPIVKVNRDAEISIKIKMRIRTVFCSKDVRI